MCETKRYIADIVGDDYKEWNNERILFESDTNTGKTWFCINVLGQYAADQCKQILYLCNRRQLRLDTQKSVYQKNLDKTITVKTYQAIQDIFKSGESLPYYDYIIADEAHYFEADALFNDYTFSACQYLDSIDNAVVIYISATAKLFFDSLLKSGRVSEKNVYKIEKSYEYVDEVVFYNYRALQGILDSILLNEPDTKILVFLNGMKRLKKMHELYPKESFFFSKGQKGYEAIRSIDRIEGNTFNTRILFTTKVLDNGVDIKDEAVKYVFSELLDIDSLIQSLGRKRTLTDEDHCKFFIRNWTNSHVTAVENSNRKIAAKIGEYEEDPVMFFRKYGHDRKLAEHYPIFDTVDIDQNGNNTLILNRAKANKIKADMRSYQEIKEIGYKDYVLRKLGGGLEQKVKEQYSQHIKNRDAVLDSLEGFVRKPIFSKSDEAKALKEIFSKYLKKALRA